MKSLSFLNRYKAAAEDQIMKAFEVLDQENKGYLTTEELTKFMSEEGITKCNLTVVLCSNIMLYGYIRNMVDKMLSKRL